jgi:hypothetical protein
MKDKKEKVKGWFTKAAQSISDKLNAWINPLSHETKKKGLIVMGVLISVVCAMPVIRSIRSNEPSSVLEVDRISRPMDIFPKDTVPEQQAERDIIRQYNRMIRFKNLVDKFNSSSDWNSLDSLMKTHPGLRDSLREFVERYYSH